MQINATFKTKLGDLHLELINDSSDFARKLQNLSDNDYMNDIKIGDLVSNATKLMQGISYFKTFLTDIKNKKKIEDAEWSEVS